MPVAALDLRAGQADWRRFQFVVYCLLSDGSEDVTEDLFEEGVLCILQPGG